MSNSTISANTASSSGSGIHNNDDTVTVVFSTVTANNAPVGSGLSSYGDTFTFTNVSASIVADNGGGGNDLDLVNGTTDSFTSGSFNVIGTADTNITAFGEPTGDLVGQSSLGLLALAFNDGGTTQTHALADGNMAVDRVTGVITIGADQAADQNGTARPQGANKDAGAYEATGVTAALCDGKLVTINLATNGGLGDATGADDVILGTPGADNIHGRAGNDTICAGAGDDTIRGGSGNDTIYAEADADTIRGGGADIIDGGTGDDIIDGQAGPDTIVGGAGSDTIDGRGAADTIEGGVGDDTINGQNGGDTMSGGPGTDTIKGQTGPDNIYGDEGDDDLAGGNGADTLYGGDGTDKCAGNLGPDSAETASCETNPGVEAFF